MKNQLAALELRVLVGEFRLIEGSRLGKVYDIAAAPATAPGGKALAFQFSAGEARRWLVCLAPSAVFISQAKPAVAESPGSFCSLLRRHLGNSVLVSVRQPGSERILELVFSSRQQQLRLVVELFSKGNVVLVDGKGVILGCAESQQWKDRTVRPGFAYSFPPAAADFAAMPAGQFQQAVLSSEKDSVVKALAVDIGLSGVYAEELCSAAGIGSSKKPEQLSPSELASLYSALQQLLSRKPGPVGVLGSNGSVAEVFPFAMAGAAPDLRRFPAFSDAVEAIATRQLEAAASASAGASSARRVKELEIAIGQQKAAIAELGKAVAESTAAAEAIYLHYAEIKQVLDDYGRLRKAFTPQQLREYFSSGRLVKSIDEKNGKITVELD